MMEILRERDEKGYGLKLYFVNENGKKKIKASKIEEEGEKRMSAPLTVHIAATNKCNMSCEFCYAMDEKFLNQEDLTHEEMLDLLQACKDANVFKISWSGGEPLIRNRFMEIIQHADELGFSQSVITNGMAINQKWIDCFKKCSIGLQLSLHEYNDPVFWKKCEMLSENEIDFVIDVVMENKLLGMVDGVVKKSKDVGARVLKFGPIIPMGKAEGNIRINEYREVLKKLLSEIEENRLSGIQIVTQFDKPRVNEMSSRFLTREDLLCEGGRTLLYIDSNGDAYPCPLFKSYNEYRCGNAKTDSIKSIWDSVEMRSYLSECSKADTCSQRKCICGVACRGLVKAYLGSITAKSPFCGILSEARIYEGN